MTVENEVEGEPDLEWEEWDGRSPFVHHCIAGSVAGVAEHTLLYPVDTVKTHMQSYCAACPHNPKQVSQSSSSVNSALHRGGSMWITVRNLLSVGNGVGTINKNSLSVSRPATNMAAVTDLSSAASALFPPGKTNRRSPYLRLWRGVQTMAVGCVPAHALYFSSYEAVKAALKDRPALGSGLAGATATVLHDLIMTPLDTVKQRLQLGHYGGMTHGLRHVVKNEGYRGLYRSFPVTLATNVPYGAIMVSTNEFLKNALRQNNKSFDVRVSLTAGCGAGLVAAALTTPLDRVKTRLQTQNLGHGTYVEESTTCLKRVQCDYRTTQARTLATVSDLPRSPSSGIKYAGWKDALRSILREEGAAGLFRGVLPRVLMHSPAVAISWTTYEGTKTWLLGTA